MKLRRTSRRAEVRELRDRCVKLTAEKQAAERDRDVWRKAAFDFDDQATSLRAEIVDIHGFLAVLGSQWLHPSGGA